MFSVFSESKTLFPIIFSQRLPHYCCAVVVVAGVVVIVSACLLAAACFVYRIRIYMYSTKSLAIVTALLRWLRIAHR